MDVRRSAPRSARLNRAADGDLGGTFRCTEHGARLVDIGFDSDIDLCATVDRYAVAGALTVEDGLPVIRPLAALGAD